MSLHVTLCTMRSPEKRVQYRNYAKIERRRHLRKKGHLLIGDNLRCGMTTDSGVERVTPHPP